MVPYHQTRLMMAVSMALYQEKVPTHIRIFQLRRNEKGTLAGLSTPNTPDEQLLNYRDTILRAARTVDPAIIDIVKNETWKRLKMHGVLLERYLPVEKGTFGLNKLGAEIESENQGVEIPMEMSWLGRVPNIKQRFKNAEVRGRLVTFMVRGQEMADLIIRRGLRILEKHYQAEAFIEVRPDTICGACSGWGHGEHNCAFPQMPRCALCAKLHRTADHECDTVGCKAPKGAVCVHLVAKCPNCKGPHGARSDSCPKKKEALEKERNWKGKESMVQKPAPTPTPEHQKIPEPAAPERVDVMERDNRLYASRHTVEDGGLSSTERKAMEAGLEDFRNGRGFASSTSLVLPTSSPPAPPPIFRYAFDQMADLKCHPTDQEKRCQSCLGKAKNVNRGVMSNRCKATTITERYKRISREKTK